MICSLTLSFLMSLIIFFFVVAMGNFSVASIVWALFLQVLFTCMTFSEQKRKGSGTVYRRIFQITFAVLFSIGFISDLLAERGSMSITSEALSSAELPFCHIAIPQVLASWFLTGNIIFPARVDGHYASIASMLCIWLMLTITIGRGWCSWVCFYGGWEEGFRHAGKKKRLNLLSHNSEIREFQFGFLAFIVLMCIGSMAAVYCDWFCPFKLVTEFAPVTSVSTLIAAVLFIGLFISLVVVLPALTKRRTQCSALCPFGAFASLTDGLSLFKVSIDTEKCIGCMKCAKACPFGAIDIKTIQDKKGSPELTCAKCGECIGECPQKAISYSFRFEKKCPRPVPRNSFEKAVQEFLDPAKLFRFCAFTFGVIMSQDFARKSLSLIANALRSL